MLNLKFEFRLLTSLRFFPPRRRGKSLSQNLSDSMDNMTIQGCRCPDRRSCTCYHYRDPNQSQFPPIHAYPSYPLSSAQWQPPGPLSTSPHPGQWSTQATALPRQYQFQNSFATAYAPPQHVHESPAFRTALGDTTSNVLNGAQLSSASQTSGNKRKRTNSNNGSRKRSNRAAGQSTMGSAPSCNIPNIPTPAVPGTGPSIGVDLAPTLHPAFSRSDGPSSHTGYSLMDDSAKNNTQVASDVWYFMRPLHSRDKPQTLPEIENLSTKRPSSHFAYLGCRLCTCVTCYEFHAFYLHAI